MPTYLEDLLQFYRLFDDAAEVGDIDLDYVFCLECTGHDSVEVTQ
jgi:hypothetical protein